MKPPLQNFKVLVTGASSGLGYTLALNLANQGAEVYAWGRNESALQSLAAQHSNIQYAIVDLTKTDTLAAAAQRTLAKMNLNAIIHNAGCQYNCLFDASDADSDADHYGSKQIIDEINTNLSAPILLTKYFLPHLRQQASVQVIFISSGLALMPKRLSAVYCASKAGIHSFAQSMALQLRDTPIRVCEFILPLIDTPMTANRRGRKLAPQIVAQRIVQEMIYPQHETVFVGKARWLPSLLRIAPWFVKKILQA